MRGKLNTRHCNFRYTGITPADAGKTSTVALSFTAYQDHPRGCGENYYSHGKGI